ncbi:MAG: hypothetical protein AAF467_26635 [Actinomycetota bacterium]
MSVLRTVLGFLRALRRAKPLPRIEPTDEQKVEIAEALQKQKARGELAGLYEYRG